MRYKQIQEWFVVSHNGEGPAVEVVVKLLHAVHCSECLFVNLCTVSLRRQQSVGRVRHWYLTPVGKLVFQDLICIARHCSQRSPAGFHESVPHLISGGRSQPEMLRPGTTPKPMEPVCREVCGGALQWLPYAGRRQGKSSIVLRRHAARPYSLEPECYRLCPEPGGFCRHPW